MRLFCALAVLTLTACPMGADPAVRPLRDITSLDAAPLPDAAPARDGGPSETGARDTGGNAETGAGSDSAPTPDAAPADAPRMDAPAPAPDAAVDMAPAPDTAPAPETAPPACVPSACGKYACAPSGTACLTSCTTNSQCQAPSVCHANACGGLKGEYFGTRDLTTKRHERIDPRIDFNWEDRSPAPDVANNNFSVRWTGKIVPAFSERYTFYTLADDGVRLTIDDVPVITDWRSHAAEEHSGSIDLVANREYRIKLEYYDESNNARVTLSWSSSSVPRETIPAARLSP